MYVYKTSGVCSREIHFDVVDNKVKEVSFVRGCNGNLQGLGRLLEGMEVEEAVKRLRGIRCQGETSCPDQFAQALEKLILHKEAEQG